MLLKLARAAAVMPATSRVVKLRVFSRVEWVLEREQQDAGQSGQHARQGPGAGGDAGRSSRLRAGQSRLDSDHGPHLQADRVHLKTATSAATTDQ